MKIHPFVFPKWQNLTRTFTRSLLIKMNKPKQQLPSVLNIDNEVPPETELSEQLLVSQNLEFAKDFVLLSSKYCANTSSDVCLNVQRKETLKNHSDLLPNMLTSNNVGETVESAEAPAATENEKTPGLNSKILPKSLLQQVTELKDHPNVLLNMSTSNNVGETVESAGAPAATENEKTPGLNSKILPKSLLQQVTELKDHPNVLLNMSTSNNVGETVKSEALASKMRVLPKSLLQQVTEFVKVNFSSISKDILKECNPRQDISSVALVPKTDKNEDFSDVHDISVLFKDKFDKEYRNNVKKKLKKKKMEKVAGSSKTETKKFPTHFVSLQIKNQNIHDKIKEVQEKIVEINNVYKKSLISPTKLHLTVMVVCLEDELSILNAKKSLETAALKLQQIYNKEGILLHVDGLDVLGNKVLFAVAKQDKLPEIADIVTESFKDNGLETTDKKKSGPFKPHITVMKLSKDFHNLRRLGVKTIDKKVWEACKDWQFGTELITELQLCSMMSSSDGYYQICHVASLTDDHQKMTETK